MSLQDISVHGSFCAVQQNSCCLAKELKQQSHYLRDPLKLLAVTRVEEEPEQELTTLLPRKGAEPSEPQHSVFGVLCQLVGKLQW